MKGATMPTIRIPFNAPPNAANGKYFPLTKKMMLIDRQRINNPSEKAEAEKTLKG